ncbi:tRNA modification GTPase [Acetitomaculum ruminis DSM 5522]|uniref:tRNA modification GTPase MnmE n=1 Tax=Acetitomaculum ruminis DSM 5522 TaxID=1120918 RepID=A0A1I0ZDF6_9FIRM|nr:tRNA uridine-5-carboxymethylaminomethyl(34) synthesis GTPase MnmE [Acetitomaculum ruminis]SFB23645.1 tRNA modification GTPase [Acetitomaculum ruminis DSM 5522]
MTEDTIAAFATPLSSAGIGIVRISGENSINIIKKIFVPYKKDTKEFQTYTAHYGFIYDGDKKIDEVIILVMKGPHSYTREDVIEINCHGGILVMKNILELVLKSGARMALPGEFTKRAFLNGRIDLTAAEAVMDLINSQNQYALDNALSNVAGKLNKKIKGLREEIITETAFLECALDDPEHYSLDGYSEKIEVKVKNLIKEIDCLIETFDNGKFVQDGIETIIVGKPNAGKSTLLNCLLGEEKAIVTDIPGTTRDINEQRLVLDGICLNMVDTAGIHDTDDVIESIGVKKSLELIEKADLILYVVDSSKELDENDKEIIDRIKEKNVIVLLNKMDISNNNTQLEKQFENIVSISAKNGEGIDNFINKLNDMFFSGNINFNEDVVISNVRHKNLLVKSKDSLELVLGAIYDGLPEDFYTVDLMDAYNFLGDIIGETFNDDLADNIFSKFCMGK